MSKHVNQRVAVMASLAACLVVLGGVLSGQEPALPAAASIVARHVEAIGGAAAYTAVKSVRLTGRFDVTGQNLSANFETVAARPARLRLQVNIPGIGLMQTGYDGTIGWSIDPQLGPRQLRDRELAELAVDADFDGTLHPADRVKEAVTVAKTEFDKRPAYRVHVVFTSGVEQMEYFDAETGLEIGWEASRATALGVVPTSAIMRDYKKFGPLLQPTTLVQKAMFLEQVLHVTSVEYDVVPDSAFELPAQIKALIK